MEQKLNNEEMTFFEYLQGGILPEGKEYWIGLKAAIELATFQAFERQAMIDCGYYGDNTLARVVRF